jgi:hypothetical protein
VGKTVKMVNIGLNKTLFFSSLVFKKCLTVKTKITIWIDGIINICGYNI